MNAKRDAQPEIQIEFNSIYRINFPVFVSVVILFPGFHMKIPRVKVALVWCTHACMIYTRHCNALQSAQTVSSFHGILDSYCRGSLSSLRASHGFRGSRPICSALQCLSQPRMPSAGRLVLNRQGGAVVRMVVPGGPEILGEA